MFRFTITASVSITASVFITASNLRLIGGAILGACAWRYLDTARTSGRLVASAFGATDGDANVSAIWKVHNDLL